MVCFFWIIYILLSCEVVARTRKPQILSTIIYAYVYLIVKKRLIVITYADNFKSI